jgi:hypothetical protein
MDTFLHFVIANAEPSMNRTFRGSLIDLSDDHRNANDSIRINRESDSNEIDKSRRQQEKHPDSRISTLRGILIDVNAESSNA